MRLNKKEDVPILTHPSTLGGTKLVGNRLQLGITGGFSHLLGIVLQIDEDAGVFNA